MRKTRRMRKMRPRSRKRGGDNREVKNNPQPINVTLQSIAEYTPHNKYDNSPNKSVNNSRLINVKRPLDVKNLEHQKFILNISKYEYDTGLETIRQRIRTLMSKKSLSSNPFRIQKEIDELTALGKEIKEKNRNEIERLHDMLYYGFNTNDKRREQLTKIEMRINSNKNANLAKHNANSKKIKQIIEKIKKIEASNNEGKKLYWEKAQLGL